MTLPAARTTRDARPRGLATWARSKRSWLALLIATLAALASTWLPLVDRDAWRTCDCDAETFALEWGGPRALLEGGLAVPLAIFVLVIVVALAWRAPPRGWLRLVRFVVAVECLLALAMVAVSVWGAAAATVLLAHGGLLVAVAVAWPRGSRTVVRGRAIVREP